MLLIGWVFQCVVDWLGGFQCVDWMGGWCVVDWLGVSVCC